MRRPLVAPAAGLVLLASLMACGSGTSTTSGGDGGPSPDASAFDVTTATLDDQPFCDRVDTTLVAPALGMAADQVKLRESLVVGEKFDHPAQEGALATSKVNSCVYGSSTSQFIVTVDPDSAAPAVQKSIDFYADLGKKGYSSEECTSVADPSFGDPAAMATCTGLKGSKRASVVVIGLVGTSKFHCAAVLNSGSIGELEEPSLEACRSALESIAAS
jgi:hypothetical protein